MKTSLLTLTAAAAVLAAGIGPSQAQQSGGGDMMEQGQMMQQDRQGAHGRGMQQGMAGMMARGIMRHGAGGHDGHGRYHGKGHGKHHGKGHGGMMQIMFAVMDANGDGALSLEEIQEAHARIFAHVDADDDGKVTQDELGAFFHGKRAALDTDE